MDKRDRTPPPVEGNPQMLLTPPATPGRPQFSLPRTVIPPSPGKPCFDLQAESSKPTAKSRASAQKNKRSQHVGVRKTASRVVKNNDRIAKTLRAEGNNNKKTTSLMDLPGEIRNIIYSHTAGNPRQSLLVHRPRIASLRTRTRLDRNRTLESDILDQKHGQALAGAIARTPGDGSVEDGGGLDETLPRETNRPFSGLTQVCRLLRQEYMPLYKRYQEIGMDLVDVESYLSTFYPDAATRLEALLTSQKREANLPFTGNMTIALGEKPNKVEKSVDGIDMGPLLHIWANSYKIEAGFGRYLQPFYDASGDGEAKDLYRLFGRRVQPNRQCSPMNLLWRKTLRAQQLAAIKLHRSPAISSSAPSPPAVHQFIQWHGNAFGFFASPVRAPQPYIHLLFKSEHAEPWMTEFESRIPRGWLAERGFDNMEYFQVKVGVAPGSEK